MGKQHPTILVVKNDDVSLYHDHAALKKGDVLLIGGREWSRDTWYHFRPVDYALELLDPKAHLTDFQILSNGGFLIKDGRVPEQTEA